MDKATKQKIEALEARIKQLEMRPPVYVSYPVYAQPYFAPQYVPQPHFPYQSPWWGVTTMGGIGASATTVLAGNSVTLNHPNALTYGPDN